MAVANTKSTAITNSDRGTSGLPDKINPLLIAGGKVISRVGVCAKLAGDSNNSVYRFMRIGSSARVKSLKLVGAAMAGLTAVDFGIYDTAANGGAVVSQTLFATGQDLHLGNTAPLDLRYASLGASTGEQALWQLLGLSADPGKSYDIAATATTAGGAAGSMVLELEEVTGQQ